MSEQSIIFAVLVFVMLVWVSPGFVLIALSIAASAWIMVTLLTTDVGIVMLLLVMFVFGFVLGRARL